MKNGTKLHFTNGVNKIEDFFMGGSLLCETDSNTYERLVKYERGGIKYALVPSDYVYIDTNNVAVVGGKTYVTILPIYDINSLKQNLECRCSIIRGELPYNIQHGIPLKSTIQEIQVSVLNIVNNTPGVTSCEVLASKLVDRRFKLELKINSNFGSFVTLLG